MSEYRVPALRIRQGEERQLYSLAIEGKQISKIAAISRKLLSSDKSCCRYFLSSSVKCV